MQGPFPWGKPALPREEDGTLYPWTGCDLDSFEQAIGDPLEWTENAQLPFVTLQHPPLDDGEAIIRPNSSDSLHHQNKGRPDGDGRDGRPGGGDRPYGAPFEATSYFTMPSTTLDNLYLLTRGSHAQGKIKYIEAEYTDTPTVSVKMYYWHRDMRSSVNICMLTHNDTSQGVGIFTPDKRWDWMPIGQRRAVFDILVTLPVGNSKRISQLEADVPNFNQLFYHVDSPLDVVRISATQGDITVEGQLRAKIIDIATSNGEIYGQFWTDESIRLETTNAGISANILMINEHTGPTSAFLKTSSGTIVIRWLLSSSANRGSPSWPGHGGNFVIDSTTSNALVYHTFEDTPLDPNVIFDTRTSKNSASVTMWRTVEGPFEMHGDIGVPLVETHLRAVDDPMQLGRDPILKILGFSEDMLEGYFHWRQASPAGDGNSNEGRNVEERTNIDNVLSPSAGVTKTKSRIRIFAENGKPMLNFV
ncbi:hypothetical protein DL93DRAFT_1599234 [Clavulina sp. PMI_390]|nr:hypothetical protein DL93DRAFT_1599234 [Clavulina sp. PMI_390]